MHPVTKYSLDLINEVRRSRHERTLDPAASGWSSGDVVAEAKRIAAETGRSWDPPASTDMPPGGRTVQIGSGVPAQRTVRINGLEIIVDTDPDRVLAAFIPKFVAMADKRVQPSSDAERVQCEKACTIADIATRLALSEDCQASMTRLSLSDLHEIQSGIHTLDEGY